MKTFKYRLCPTKKQREQLEQTLALCCELYNAALQERRDAWKMSGISLNFASQSAQLPAIKEIRHEYQDIYGQVLQDVLHRVDKTFKAFFRRCKAGEKAGYPRFRSTSRYDSFTYPQAEHGFSLTHDNRLCLSKVGSIKVKLHRSVEGAIRTCTLKREGPHWYVVLTCEVEQIQRSPYTDDMVGVDLGLTHFAALSTGAFIDNPRYYRKSEKELKVAQQALSRKKRGSKRRKKAVQRVAKHHRKVKNQRQDFLHQWSRRLVSTYETIVFEDLNPSNMSKRPKPKPNGDGTYAPNGASKKAGLNKSIRDAGWSTFVTMCEYKAGYAGTVTVVKVSPYKTSQICSGCGVEGPYKDLSVRWHQCECGASLDRDVNAAINIKNRWLGRSLQETRF